MRLIVIFPSYVSNTTANPALDSGQVGYAGNDVADIQGNYLGASPDKRTWTSSQPWFASNNVVTLWPNTAGAVHRHRRRRDPAAGAGQAGDGHGHPGAGDPYIDPVPNAPYMEDAAAPHPGLLRGVIHALPHTRPIPAGNRDA